MTLEKIKKTLELHGVKTVFFAYDLYAVDQYTNHFKLVKVNGWNRSELLNFLNY